MREQTYCWDAYPCLPHYRVCTGYPGHAGPHTDGTHRWTGEESAACREEVSRATIEAQERAAYNARLEVLGQRPPLGGLVGNRVQRRANLRKGR